MNNNSKMFLHWIITIKKRKKKLKDTCVMYNYNYVILCYQAFINCLYTSYECLKGGVIVVNKNINKL